MKYKAVIFDLDGTLLDTLQDLADSTNRILAAADLPTHPLDEYRYLVGQGMTNLIRNALPEPMRTDTQVREFQKAMFEDYAGHWADTTEPYAGIPAMLTALDSGGLRLAVFSNKVHDLTKELVQHMLGDFSFAPVFGAREGIPIKPDPEVALEIADLLGLAPDDIAYVGDTCIDMQTGIAAGFFTIGVTWGFRPREELLEHGAHALADTPEELVTLIT